MSYILAVFRNRTVSISFANKLRKYNVQCGIVPTPKDIGSTCGVSVKFALGNLPQAMHLLQSEKFGYFHNFYKVYTIGGKTIFEVVRR